MELSVLVYNIEYAGDASTDRVIREIDADIVGVLESYNRLPEIARRLPAKPDIRPRTLQTGTLSMPCHSKPN